MPAFCPHADSHVVDPCAKTHLLHQRAVALSGATPARHLWLPQSIKIIKILSALLEMVRCWCRHHDSTKHVLFCLFGISRNTSSTSDYCALNTKHDCVHTITHRRCFARHTFFPSVRGECPSLCGFYPHSLRPRGLPPEHALGSGQPSPLIYRSTFQETEAVAQSLTYM